MLKIPVITGSGQKYFIKYCENIINISFRLFSRSKLSAGSELPSETAETSAVLNLPSSGQNRKITVF
jgi:hypothetical protein